LGGFSVFVSCKKENSQIETGSIKVMLHYTVDQQPLIFDSLIYSNKAGNIFSVTHLEYYISDVKLIDKNANEIIRKNVHYINARTESTNQFTISNVSLQDYSSILFKIGLKSDTNKTGYLPPTIENQNMSWPDPMGGGYHFLKLEGHYIDSLTAILGYAMHLGTNTCLVNCRIDKPFSVNSKNQTLDLEMNINEWFENPNIYDLNLGGYIMGNQTQMLKIAQNGGDVFTLK
jgi:hypothetical protein